MIKVKQNAHLHYHSYLEISPVPILLKFNIDDFLTVGYNWYFILRLSSQNLLTHKGRPTRGSAFGPDPCNNSLGDLDAEEQMKLSSNCVVENWFLGIYDANCFKRLLN